MMEADSPAPPPFRSLNPFRGDLHPRPVEWRPLFFIGIAVPRDIDPAVGEIEECKRIIDSELAKLKLPGT